MCQWGSRWQEMGAWMRVSWGAAAAAVVFGAGVLAGNSDWPVRDIYRVGYQIGKYIGRREGAAQEAARGGLGVPPGPRRPVGSQG